MRSDKLYFVPMVDQVEEEKTPKDCEGGRGHTQVYTTQRWNRRRRRKLRMTVKALSRVGSDHRPVTILVDQKTPVSTFKRAPN